MLIVCTQDKDVIDFTAGRGSGAELWGNNVVLPGGAQRIADIEFVRALEAVGRNEDLCLSAHGNNFEIGDETSDGWGWSFADIATMLAGHLPRGYSGRILIRACSKSVASFAANLAVELGARGRLLGIWIYGYQKALDIDTKYPVPDNMDKNAELAPHKVTSSADAPRPKSRCGLSYQVMTRLGHVLQVPVGFDAREVQILLSALTLEQSSITTAEVTALTSLVVKTAAGTVVLTGNAGEWDSEKGMLYVNTQGSAQQNGGPQEDEPYIVDYQTKDGAGSKEVTFKGYFAGVGYDFKVS